ncbi:MAG: FliM/FliN family flagellar motor switch protein [Candidatus Gastranaerophilales bacterium]|nr:FliM/FliN family flagellar motor switch protein [Candidatus Gastranaerophilales bacterium]
MSATKEYLAPNVDLKLVSVTERDNILFAGEEYFVTKIRITKDLNILIRLSKTAIDGILTNILGENKGKFELESVTELEANLITSYNDFVFKSFSQFLLDLSKYKKVKNLFDTHLTFFIKSNGYELGKLIISIPEAAIPELPPASPVDSFSIDDFPKTKVKVNLAVGCSKLTLNDVKNIEVDDIVLLENSNINKMILKVNGENKPFKLVPDPSLIIDFDGDSDNDGGLNMDEKTIHTGNMWDSIQVDLSAEFEQVKIPLGDLRQISEGLVVDIGSVYENKIDLKVENKTIASGELVIINDRYGVRVDKVYNEHSETKKVAEADEKEPQPQEKPAEQNDDFNEEDFDYGNFEIEDENI